MQNLKFTRDFLSFNKEKGFTLVEFLVVIGIAAILLTVASINLIRPQRTASLDATVITLVTDIKHQQLKTMIGASSGTTTAQNYGVYFTLNNYTIFKGASYNSNDSTNYTVTLDPSLTITTDLPITPQLVFIRRSGEVSNYDATKHTITIQDSVSQISKTITFNKYGVLTVN
jgi:prepilin-type N-terminal cleavage/methylation domain-containing protein